MVDFLNTLCKSSKSVKSTEVIETLERFILRDIEILEDIEADYNAFYKGIKQSIQRTLSLPKETREYRSAQQLRNIWHKMAAVAARGF